MGNIIKTLMVLIVTGTVAMALVRNRRALDGRWATWMGWLTKARRDKPDQIRIADQTDLDSRMSEGTSQEEAASKQTGTNVDPGSQFFLGYVVPRRRTKVRPILSAKLEEKEPKPIHTQLRQEKLKILVSMYNRPGLPMLCIGPTGSGKSSSIIAPNLMTQTDNSTYAVSVKDDIARVSIESRLKVAQRWNEQDRWQKDRHGNPVIDNQGQRIPTGPEAFVGIYAPLRNFISPHLQHYAMSYSPLTTAWDPAEADLTAKSLVTAAASIGGNGASSDSGKFFTDATATLLGDLLYLNAVAGQNRTMRDVFKQVQQAQRYFSWEPLIYGHIDHVLGGAALDPDIVAKFNLPKHYDQGRTPLLKSFISDDPDEDEQAQLAEDSEHIRDIKERLIGISKQAENGAGGQLAGTLSTLIQALDKYGKTDVGLIHADEGVNTIHLDDFLQSYSTLYVVLSEDNAAEFAPDIAALTEALLRRINEEAGNNIGDTSSEGNRLPIRLVLCLDELANLSLVNQARLQTLVSTCRSRGVALMMACQDLSQMYHRYGREVTMSMVNNCSSLLFFPGLKCKETIEYVERIFGRQKKLNLSITSTPEHTTKSSTGDSTSSAVESENTSLADDWNVPAARLSEMRDLEIYAASGASKLHLLARRWFTDHDLDLLAKGQKSPYDMTSATLSRQVEADLPDEDSIGGEDTIESVSE